MVIHLTLILQQLFISSLEAPLNSCNIAILFSSSLWKIIFIALLEFSPKSLLAIWKCYKCIIKFSKATWCWSGLKFVVSNSIASHSGRIDLVYANAIFFIICNFPYKACTSTNSVIERTKYCKRINVILMDERKILLQKTHSYYWDNTENWKNLNFTFSLSIWKIAQKMRMK